RGHCEIAKVGQGARAVSDLSFSPRRRGSARALSAAFAWVPARKEKTLSIILSSSQAIPYLPFDLEICNNSQAENRSRLPIRSPLFHTFFPLVGETPMNRNLNQISTQWSLVCRANQGPTEAGNSARQQLLERYGGAIRRHLRSVLIDADAADEI